MHKKITIFVIFLLTVKFIFSQDFSSPPEGYNFPKTKAEEKARKKALRLSLSRKELSIHLKKQSGKHKLTYWEEFRYIFIKRKVKKLEELQAKYNAKFYGNQPAIVQDKYYLTVKEKEVLAKQERGEELTKKDQKVLRKAMKKEKKRQKKLESIKKKEFTDEEKEVQRKAKININLLTPEEKEILKQVREKEEYNRKADKRRTEYQTDSLIKIGAPVPKLPLKYRLKRLLPSFKSNSQKPSSYVRKYERLVRKYHVTDEEKELIAKRKRGEVLSPFQKIRADRAATKDYWLREDIKRLNQKYYYRFQPKDSRKLIREAQRNSKKKNQKKR